MRTYLDRKTSVIATLRSIGADNATVFQTYFLQIAALSSIGILIGLILGIGAPIAIEPVLSAMLPFPITLTVFARPIIEATLYGALAALIFTIWPLARAENIKAAILFRDGGGTAARLPAHLRDHHLGPDGDFACLCLLFHRFHRADTVDRGGCNWSIGNSVNRGHRHPQTCPWFAKLVQRAFHLTLGTFGDWRHI